MRRGQLPELPGEALLAVVVEVDSGEDERLVFVERGADRGDGVGAQGPGEVES